LTTAVQQKLFSEKIYENRQVLTSSGIKKRAKTVLQKRTQARQKYAKRGSPEDEEVSGGVSGEFQAQKPDRNPTKGSKGKGSKGKNVNDSPPAAPAAAPVPAPAEPPKPSELTGDVALQLVKQYPAETDAQIAIRECWQAFKLDGTPGGKLYSGLVKLVGEQGYPKVQAWAAYVRDDPPQLPAGAKPMAWFAQQFRRGMNRDFLWDDSGKQRALSKPYEEPSSNIGRGDVMTRDEINAASVPLTPEQHAASFAALQKARGLLPARAVLDDTEPENDSEEEAMHRQEVDI